MEENRPKTSVMKLIIEYLKMRIMVRLETKITSHELENEGRRFIERGKGKTVNPSTVSRKWRLLKFDEDDPMVRSLDPDEDYVIVKELQKQTNSTEGVWRVLNISGTPVADMVSSGKSQMTMF